MKDRRLVAVVALPHPEVPALIRRGDQDTQSDSREREAAEELEMPREERPRSVDERRDGRQTARDRQTGRVIDREQSEDPRALGVPPHVLLRELALVGG